MDLKELKETAEGSGRHPWEQARLKVVGKLMDTYLPGLRNKEDFILLDVGCGDTYFIEQMSLKYPEARMFGIDTAFDAAQLQQFEKKFSRTPIRVFDSMDKAAPSINKSVDVVLLLDVIEHIADDIAFLKWLRGFEFITSDTVFIISVPAYQSLFCSHDVFLDHYRRYTNTMLEDHIRQAGLEKMQVGYFFFSLLPPRILQVIREKLSGASPDAKGLAAWNGSRFSEAIVRFVLWSDFRLSFLLRKAGIKLPGLSNYILCKKPAS